jgi:hypothetical protein
MGDDALFDRHLKLFDTYNETAISLGKWLLSSFLAMNGTAVIATISRDDSQDFTVTLAATIFAAGIAAAIAGGMVTWLFWNSNARWHAGIVQAMMLNPSPTPQTFADLDGRYKIHDLRQRRLSNASQILAALSAACLVAGTIALIWR